mgnify:FL=1
MEKRKLASVQYVHHITPIEGADRIECVHVLGWQCVADKGQFKYENGMYRRVLLYFEKFLELQAV